VVVGLLKTGRTCQVQDPFIEDNESGAMKKNTGVSHSEYKLYRSQQYVVRVECYSDVGLKMHFIIKYKKISEMNGRKSIAVKYFFFSV
jgi:hypothetical protein